MDWETSFATYINPFPLWGCECCLVAALACSFSKSTRVSLTCKRYGSLLTRVSHLLSPSDGLSSFPQDHTRKWCQGSAENSVLEIFISDGNRTRNLCVSSLALCCPSSAYIQVFFWSLRDYFFHIHNNYTT